jgi:mono/diheme cytochrome c family protein
VYRNFFLMILLLILVSTATAIPRYSAQYNQSCILCHVDPSGGGARSLYGAQFFAYTELATQGLNRI